MKVGIIRSIVFQVIPTFGFGWQRSVPQWGLPGYFTIQVMWMYRGLYFDWHRKLAK